MREKKIMGISILAVLVLAVLVATYVLVVLPKQEELILGEEIAKVEEGESLQAGEVSTTSWDLNRVNIVYDTENVPVPVPKGYTASSIDGEHTVNDGFVIYEGEDEVTDTNKDEAQKTRNQWVWVPIYDASEIYGTDSNGMIHGKIYKYTSVGRTANYWTETNGVMSSRTYREPAIGNDEKDSFLSNYLSEEERKEFYKELQKEFERNIESIKKYGGFYIGRYETGGLSGEAKVVKMNTDISKQTVYTMYEKSKELRGINSNVRTNIIWGSLWDATIEWLVNSGEKTYSEIGTDSDRMGKL